MRRQQIQWRWEDGTVDEATEHIELRHGDAATTPYENWFSIARIGKPTHHRFRVQWLLKADGVQNQAMVADARRELDFYLVDKNEPNPWAYARYHCTTTANMYSRVHWCYFPNGGGRQTGVKHGRSTLCGGSGRTFRKIGNKRQVEQE